MFFPQYLSMCLFCALCCFIPVPPLPQTPAVTRPGYKLGPSLAPDRAWCWPSSTHSLAPLRAQAAAFFLWQRQQGEKKGRLAGNRTLSWLRSAAIVDAEAEAAIRRLGRGSCSTASTRKHKGRRRSCSEAPAGQGSAQTFWSSKRVCSDGLGREAPYTKRSHEKGHLMA